MRRAGMSLGTQCGVPGCPLAPSAACRDVPRFLLASVGFSGSVAGSKNRWQNVKLRFFCGIHLVAPRGCRCVTEHEYESGVGSIHMSGVESI